MCHQVPSLVASSGPDGRHRAAPYREVSPLCAGVGIFVGILAASREEPNRPQPLPHNDCRGTPARTRTWDLRIRSTREGIHSDPLPPKKPVNTGSGRCASRSTRTHSHLNWGTSGVRNRARSHKPGLQIRIPAPTDRCHQQAAAQIMSCLIGAATTGADGATDQQMPAPSLAESGTRREARHTGIPEGSPF